MSIRFFHALFLATAVALAAPAFAQQREMETQPAFVEVTKSAGIRFQHSFGDEKMSNILEASGSGCAFFDYNNDGWMDLYLVNGGYLPVLNDGPADSSDVRAANVLYRNNGDGTFTDVTARAGVGDRGYGLGCAAGDIDNDGDEDLYVTNYGRNTLYRNNGDGTFTDITRAAGVGDTLAGIGCTFLDYDNDGFLDLFVGNYLQYDPKYRLYYAANEFPGPLAYTGQPDVLYHNNGDGTFTDVTARAGVLKSGRAMGVAAADYDGDGWVDLFVANDAMENYLYHNNGDGTFTDVALEAGVAFSSSGDASSSMGGDFGDFDNDGNLDLLVPDMRFNNLYRNNGDGTFTDVTAVSGLAEVSGQFVSWGGNFGDFDNDGNLDILISNGSSERLDGTMEALLLTNVLGPHGVRLFRDLTNARSWFRHKAVSRGLAVADYDNDGDLDFFVVNLDQPSELVRNDGGNRKHWLEVKLVGTRCNRDGIGARVRVRAGGRTLTAERVSASGYLSQSDPRLHFGLGDLDRVQWVEVHWPGGGTQKLVNVAADQILTVTEPGDFQKSERGEGGR